MPQIHRSLPKVGDGLLCSQRLGQRLTWPQFSRRESVAARRLYQGILLFTWWGTCTLMSWQRNSTL